MTNSLCPNWYMVTINKRYIGTGVFVELIQKGFIGSQNSNTIKVAAFMEAAVKDAHSVMYAIANRKEQPIVTPKKTDTALQGSFWGSRQFYFLTTRCIKPGSFSNLSVSSCIISCTSCLI
jgi:hypothetical protein